jgi:hypothetical protein
VQSAFSKVNLKKSVGRLLTAESPILKQAIYGWTHPIIGNLDSLPKKSNPGYCKVLFMLYYFILNPNFCVSKALPFGMAICSPDYL